MWCNSLTTIPEGLFDHCTKVTNFYGTFDWCSALQSIPAGLFDKCTLVTSFVYTFRACSLSGESPYTIINGVKVHLYERYLYPQYFTAPTAYNLCFYKSEGLTDYGSIPSDWKY